VDRVNVGGTDILTAAEVLGRVRTAGAVAAGAAEVTPGGDIRAVTGLEMLLFVSGRTVTPLFEACPGAQVGAASARGASALSTRRQIRVLVRIGAIPWQFLIADSFVAAQEHHPERRHSQQQEHGAK
jgi:hypothetical protein